MFDNRIEVTLNVGLLNNPELDGLGAHHVADWFAEWLEASGLDLLENSAVEIALADTVARDEFQASDYVTEPTAIVRFDLWDADGLEAAIEALCALTTQDAIAWTYRFPNGVIAGKSGLTGPKAANWGGAFIGAFFERGDALSFQWGVS